MLAATLKAHLGLGNGQTSMLFAEGFSKGFLGLKVTALNLSSCLGAKICQERMPNKDVIFEIILASGCEQANWGAAVGNDKLSPFFPSLLDNNVVAWAFAL